MGSSGVGVRRFSSSLGGGGGKDPNKPSHTPPVKGHYIDYFNLLRKTFNQNLYKLPNGIFIFKHQVNKGGEHEIMKGGGLKGMEGRFGGSYARATSATLPDVRASNLPLIFFTTADRPISDHEGAMTGIQWEDFLHFINAVCIHPDGNVTTYGPAFEDDKKT